MVLTPGSESPKCLILPSPIHFSMSDMPLSAISSLWNKKTTLKPITARLVVVMSSGENFGTRSPQLWDTFQPFSNSDPFARSTFSEPFGAHSLGYGFQENFGATTSPAVPVA